MGIDSTEAVPFARGIADPESRTNSRFSLFHSPSHESGESVKQATNGA
jgi:hypothetical protein